MAGKPHPDDPRRCSATSRRTGERCGAWAVSGRDTCYHHGGVTPRGIGSPHAKHLRYSKSVPARLSGSYQEVMDDARKLELGDEVALLVARNEQILETLFSGESDGLWRRLAKEKRAMENARRKARAARERGDAEAEARHATAGAEHLNELMRMIERGAPDGERWAELMEVVTTQRKLAESERKRKVEDHQMATTEEVMAMLAAVSEIARRHAPDVPTLRALARDLDALAEQAARRRREAG